MKPLYQKEREVLNFHLSLQYGKEDLESELCKFGINVRCIESMKKIRYLFPKTHAAVYTIQSFQVAWYKVHHPIHFYSILLNSMDSDNVFTASEFEKSPYGLQKELEGLKAQASDDWWGEFYRDKRVYALELLKDLSEHGYTCVPFNDQEVRDGTNSKLKVLAKEAETSAE